MMIVPYTRLVGFLCDTSEDDKAENGDETITDILIFVYDLETNVLENSDHYKIEPNLNSSLSQGKLDVTAVVNKVKSILSGRETKSCLCTFGPHHMRMMLHPICFRNNIDLSEDFYTYFDLQHLFKVFYGSQQSVDQKVQDSLLYILEKIEFLKDCGMNIISEISRLLGKMVEDGFKFTDPEYIMKDYQPCLWKGEIIGDELVVKARGLPWNSTETDVANFFKGLNIERGGVALCMTSQGRKNGEAMVRFETKEHRSMALKRHKHYLGTRYIEVFRSTGKEFIHCLANTNKETKALLMQKYDFIDPMIIRMRGLPYTCKQSQVVEFFKASPNGCEVLDGEDGVLLIHQSEGKNTGDAFVLFANEDDATKALTKHKQCIGMRYIELFKSAVTEVQQILNKSFDPRSPTISMNSSNSPISHIRSSPSPQPHILYQIQSSSKVKDCVLLSGLPLETSINDLVFFLSDHVKDIRHKGIHLIHDIQGVQTGEALIEMVSEKQAEFFQESRNGKMILVSGNRYHVSAKKCSIDEIAHSLYGHQNQPITSKEAYVEQQSPKYQDNTSPSHQAMAALSPVYFSCQPSYHLITVLPTNRLAFLTPNNINSINLNKTFDDKIKIR